MNSRTPKGDSEKRSRTPSAPTPDDISTAEELRRALGDATLDFPEPPPDEAMPEAARPERRAHLSFSQLDTYRSCSWKYYLRYLTDIPGEPSLPLAVGSAGHSALEKNARRKIKTGADMPLPDLLDFFSDVYDDETSDIKPENLDDDEDIGKSKDLTVEVIKVHHVKRAPRVLPVVVEWEFNIDLSIPEYDYPLRVINGKVDIIDTNYNVFDYKFPSRRNPKTVSEANMSPQLTLYDRAFFLSTGKYPMKLGFISMLPPGVDPVKTPAEPREVPRDREEMRPSVRAARWDRLAFQFMQTDKAIDAGIFIPADDPKTCSWCDYRKICQNSLVKDDYLAASIRAKTGEPK